MMNTFGKSENTVGIGSNPKKMQAICPMHFSNVTTLPLMPQP
jgi:hypothetical protein